MTGNKLYCGCSGYNIQVKNSSCYKLPTRTKHGSILYLQETDFLPALSSGGGFMLIYIANFLLRYKKVVGETNHIYPSNSWWNSLCRRFISWCNSRKGNAIITLFLFSFLIWSAKLVRKFFILCKLIFYYLFIFLFGGWKIGIIGEDFLALKQGNNRIIPNWVWHPSHGHQQWLHIYSHKMW